MKKIIRLFILIVPLAGFAQTDIDGIMMAKNNFCIGPMYGHSSWKNYWEGSLKRDNENLGTLSTQTFLVAGNFGISSKLNLLFGLPYVKTNATAGTLHGLQGFQDASLWLKYMPVETNLGKGTISVYGVGGISLPVTNYSPDFLPLSIGLHSTSLSLRGMVDYQLGRFFATGSATYVLRSNIKIDRTAYYTTEMHLTNEVEMPNALSFNIRAGWRSKYLIAEAVLNDWKTLGGFDITRNNMPFPSNRMNATNLGVNLKYALKAIEGLSVTGGSNYTVAGRNVGQATNYNIGVFYILDLNRKAQPAKTTAPQPATN